MNIFFTNHKYRRRRKRRRRSHTAPQTAHFTPYKSTSVLFSLSLSPHSSMAATKPNSTLSPPPSPETLEFKWGKKRGKGGKKRDTQFYESFTFDGEDYSLFDTVYLQNGNEPQSEPHIGKIIKIWEVPNREKAKKVKIQWFFRPREVSKFLKRIQIYYNELFFATGVGNGLTNINPVESIAGKCNVVCISKDARNPQPSDEAVQNADFVFYRYFDVGQRKIVEEEEVDEKSVGIDD
ncbi:protein ANTI-SILENCING 1 isoform X5 [Medicago truncatula]|uniref:protein ANTI-SILENCING 1 isoform X3 n=1 Tax=Medicago truncatula TaxID=3880 RepID=UPI000D2F359C|nr:protein ANTI-SILENCING 1 isoform X3 [Medicago truncatula]XP_024630970.1 protein ANTI-SILENCING 1 isoform X4 [Medicago truncatula]XP_024630971.1 protein ANTI-SILENCING 1 isoform X5 [Medicago truncatula]